MTFQIMYGFVGSAFTWKTRSSGWTSQRQSTFVNAVFWGLRTGAPWRDLPPEYGDWKNTHRRFCRWRDNGTWEHILAKLMDMPDFKWIMIDSTHCKVHPHAAGTKGDNQDMGRTKGGSIPRYIWPWMRIAGQNHYYSGFLF